MSDQTGEITVSRQISRFNWRIQKFDTIWPESDPIWPNYSPRRFSTIVSPIIHVNDLNGVKTKWSLHLRVNGIESIECFLHLDSSYEEIQNYTTWGIKCTFTVGLGHARGFALKNRITYRFTNKNLDSGAINLKSFADLYGNRQKFLLNNTLRLVIEIEIANEGYPINFSRATTFTLKRERDESTENKFYMDFEELLNSKKFSDVQIHCDGTDFHCHKAILSARSNVFRTMFDTNMTETKESKIVIEDIQPSALSTILKYIYTGNLCSADTFPGWIELIHGAEKYNLAELKNYCFEQLLQSMTEENAGAVAVTAHTYDADSTLQLAIREFCHHHMGALMASSSFRELLFANPKAFYPD